MIFVFTFAVGGGSGKVIPFPTWALVRLHPQFTRQLLIVHKNPKGNPDYCKRLSDWSRLMSNLIYENFEHISSPIDRLPVLLFWKAAIVFAIKSRIAPRERMQFEWKRDLFGFVIFGMFLLIDRGSLLSAAGVLPASFFNLQFFAIFMLFQRRWPCKFHTNSLRHSSLSSYIRPQ